MTVIQASVLGLAAIADAVDLALLVADYPLDDGGEFNQHGVNVLWIGLAKLINFWVWLPNRQTSDVA